MFSLGLRQSRRVYHPGTHDFSRRQPSGPLQKRERVCRRPPPPPDVLCPLDSRQPRRLGHLRRPAGPILRVGPRIVHPHVSAIPRPDAVLDGLCDVDTCAGVHVSGN